MKYIEYPKGDNGWIPKSLRNLDLKFIKEIRRSQTDSGWQYNVCIGSISDEDATFLELQSTYKVKFRKNP